MYRFNGIFLILFFPFLAPYNPITAQMRVDTVQMSLKEAEAAFQKNNLQLLLQQYSIDSARAAVITARLYDNPQFGLGHTLYQPQTKKLFGLGVDSTAEVFFQVSQLIKTAGKRNKAVQVAKTGVQISEFQFYEVLRTLRFVLRNDFYNLYYLQQMQKVYQVEIDALQKSTDAFEKQVVNGNIAKKELIRIKSQLYTLQSELLTLQGTIDDVGSEFKLLIRAKADAYIIPIIQIDETQKTIIQKYSYQTLLDSALANRYDLKIAHALQTQNQQNLSLQKALAVPDITLNLGYDRLGSYVRNYNNIGAGISIPLFNRNQGNIKQALAMMESGKVQLTQTQDAIESQVANVYIGAVKAERLLNSFDPGFEQDFNALINEVTRNYTIRNINLLEFIDFYDSYKQNVLQLNSLRFNRISQLEQMNFTTGTILFNK